MTRARTVLSLTFMAFGSLAAGPWLAADTAFSKSDAESLRRKIAIISEHGLTQNRQSRRTTVEEPEVNAYLRFEIAERIPSGIMEPYVTILGEGRLSGRAVVDLDVVRRERQRGWLDPLSYLSGRMPVTATGVLHTKDGVGRFELESADVSGVPVPKIFLQELVTHYTRTDDRPRGLNLDEPFELPAHIRDIELGRGQAVVVQ